MVHVRVIGTHRLFVRFADDTEGEVDLAPLLAEADPGAFEPLKDPALFGKVHLHAGAVAWPGGLDLAPDAMYDDIKATGRRVVAGPSGAEARRPRRKDG